MVVILITTMHSVEGIVKVNKMIDLKDFKKLTVGSIEWEDKLDLVFKELRALREVEKAAKDMIGDKSIQLKLALKKLDEARQK